MDCVRSKPRLMNVEDDRLSMLPDAVIHKILSFLSIKDAIGTSSLSTRWRFLWTSMPYLNISNDDPEFVNRFLSHRNVEVEVYSVKLRFDKTFSEPLLERVLDYAFSHNVKELTVSFLIHQRIVLPVYLFRSRSLQYLRITGVRFRYMDEYTIVLAPSWEFPNLTTLHLDYAAFFDDTIFSKCANLKNLILNNFTVLKARCFTLCHPGLSDLTLKDNHWTTKPVNVVAPELKNLDVRSGFDEHLLTVKAPNLASLLFHGSRLLQFSTDLPSLEKVDLCISPGDAWSSYRIAALFQGLHNAKFLTLNLEFIEPLNSYMEGISLQPSPFSNLKSLKIYPADLPEDEDQKINMTSKVVNYFTDGSPSATFTLISYEEIKEKQQKAQAIADAATAQILMARLHVVLEKEKANIESEITRTSPVEIREENSTDEEENSADEEENNADEEDNSADEEDNSADEEEEENSADEEEKDTDDQGKAPVQKMQLHFKRKLSQMERCSEDVVVRIRRGKRKTRLIISKLRAIEVSLLKDLPTSKKEELQSCYSSLCSEVHTVVEKILHHMMIPHFLLSDCFNELATASRPSS